MALRFSSFGLLDPASSIGPNVPTSPGVQTPKDTSPASGSTAGTGSTGAAKTARDAMPKQRLNVEPVPTGTFEMPAPSVSPAAKSGWILPTSLPGIPAAMQKMQAAAASKQTIPGTKVEVEGGGKGGTDALDLRRLLGKKREEQKEEPPAEEEPSGLPSWLPIAGILLGGILIVTVFMRKK